MPKLSIEGAIGIGVAVILFILDKMGIGGTLLYIFLFSIATGLCVDSTVRSDWAKDSRKRKMWGGIGMLTAYCLFGAWIFLRPHAKAESENKPPAIDVLLQAQLKELEQLQSFIGAKDENELREVFGFQKLVEVNLGIQRSGRAPDKYTAEQIAAINAYIKSNVMEGDTRFGTSSNVDGRLTFTGNKGAVAMITLPNEYVAGHAALKKFESSMTLPSTVRSALLELDKTVTDNTTLLFDVLNEKVSQNPNNIIFYDDSQSKFFRVVPNIYWGRFVPLRPKVEKVLEATRNYLKVDQH